jgi:uncharacterized protein
VRVVLDTNVILAAYGFGGLCRAVLEVCIDDHELVVSEHLLGELHCHLRETLNHSESEAGERMKLLREAATVVHPMEVSATACRDPDDLPVLGTLIAGSADCLVTGDNDLLILREFQGRPILSPREFWEKLRALASSNPPTG